MSKNTQHGFLTLNQSDSIQVTSDDGWSQISVKNSTNSAGNVTITGNQTRTIGGRTCGSIILEPGDSFTFGEWDTIMGTVTIATAVGTTAYIGAYSVQNIIIKN